MTHMAARRSHAWASHSPRETSAFTQNTIIPYLSSETGVAGLSGSSIT